MSQTSPAAFTLDPHVKKQITPLIEKIRNLALRRGDAALWDVGTLLGVGRSRRGRRVNEPVKMNPEEFKLQISQFGIVLTSAECNLLLLAFRDAVGYLVVSDLVTHLKATLTPAREAIVREAFAAVEAPGTGTATIGDLLQRYDASRHPVVLAGRAKPENVHQQFAEAFDPQKVPDGRVTFEEFRSYYAGISCGIAEDDAFVEMVRSAWDLYERPPPPPKEVCYVPGASGTATDCWSASRGRIPGPPITKHIAGFTGHIPTAIDHYGETFYTVDRTVPDIVTPTHAYIAPHGEVRDGPLMLRRANKANQHNFTFA